MQQNSTKVPAQFLITVAKINELLRYYRIAKRVDKSNLKDRVQKKCIEMINSLRSFKQFQKMEKQLMELMKSSVNEELKPVPSSKKSNIEKIPANNSSKIPSLQQMSPVSSIQIISMNSSLSSQGQKQLNINLEHKNSMDSSKQQKLILSSNSIKYKINQNVLNSSQQPLSSELINSQSLQNSKQQQYESEASNYELKVQQLITFLDNNRGSIAKYLIFNDDLFDPIGETDDNIYLFGINCPDQRKIKKIYACTLMKFTPQDIFKSYDDRFERQMKNFVNNIKIPLGIIIKGQNQQKIYPQHLRFLININSIFPLVLILTNKNNTQGILYSFNKNCIDKNRKSNLKQIGGLASEMRQNLLKQQLGQQNFAKDKEKYVITKFLQKIVNVNTEEAPNAITISDNECIREEKHNFPYKTCNKFLNSTKENYGIYFVNNLNIIYAKTGFKDFQPFKKYVQSISPKQPYLLSVKVGKDSDVVKKQFFELVYQVSATCDPHFLANIMSLNNKKTVVLTLKKDITAAMFAQNPQISFKNLQKDTSITYCNQIITKNNYKQFQTEGKVQLIDFKPKP